MSYTPFQAPILALLFGDRQIAALFSPAAELAAMLRFEAELALAEAAHGVIANDAADAIVAACDGFEPDMQALADATAADGVVVPELVRQLRAAIGTPHGQSCHNGATSQDVIDTALILRLREAVAVLDSRLEAVCDLLDGLLERFGGNSLMARTRMQQALSVTVADRLRNWRDPLVRRRTRLSELTPTLLTLQFGGPVGTLSGLGDKAALVTKSLADGLDLAIPERAWHTDRSSIIEFADWLSLTAGLIGKIGADVMLMAQNEIGEIRLSGTGGSSAMPHKHNPVLAESLMTLARFTATLCAGMQHAAVHEQERSGAAWSLEWLLLPQLCVATGAACRNAASLLETVEHMGTPDR